MLSALTSSMPLRFTLLAAIGLAARTSPAPGQGITVNPTPFVDLMGVTAGGEVRFARAVGAARLSDGTIAIADAGESSIRVVDQTGRLRRTIGQQGGGPGEFRAITWMGHCGRDSLLIHDLWTQRLTLLVPDGAVLRASTSRVNPALLSCAAGGRLAVLRRPTTPPPSGAEEGWVSAMLTLTTVTEAAPRDIGTIHAFQYSRPFGVMFPRPLGAVALLALSSDHLYVGTGDSAAVDVRDATDGRLVRHIHVDAAPRKPSAAHISAAAAAIGSYQLDEASRRAVERKMASVPMPAVLPPYSAILADPTGALWVVTSTPGDAVTTLQAYDPGGRLLGRVSIPRPVAVYEIGLDYVLGAFEDATGEQHIQLYRLGR